MNCKGLRIINRIQRKIEMPARRHISPMYPLVFCFKDFKDKDYGFRSANNKNGRE